MMVPYSSFDRTKALLKIFTQKVLVKLFEFLTMITNVLKEDLTQFPPHAYWTTDNYQRLYSDLYLHVYLTRNLQK